MNNDELIWITKGSNSNNNDLRLYAAGKGVRLWQVAARFGVTDAAFSRKMRKPFTDDDANRFRSYVDEIAADGN